VAARITGDTSRLASAELAAETVLSSPSATDFHVLVARTGLAMIAVQRGDIEAAVEQYAALKSVPGIMLIYLSIDRVLGLLTHTMSQYEQAISHFEDALDFCRKAGYRPELAWTCCDYADTLLQRDQPGDQIRAQSLWEEALAISRELGMKPLMERVAGRLEWLAAQPAPQPVYPDGLTQREVEVLRLIAAGLGNPDIAAELVISLNTVARHVSNIFSKIGAANRAEAATYAYRHGLVQ
jgi:ATP/maltotriose-dependent transcriptional regulator MalT